MMKSAPEAWGGGDAYEPYVGRWSRLVAARFVPSLRIPAEARWLDIGCGTGALARAILDDADPARVQGVDPSEGFIRYSTGRILDRRAAFCVADAMALPFGDGMFDVTLSGLVLNFVPDPPRAVAEMVRATRPGGTVAAYVWDYARGMEPIRRFWDAACALDPGAAAFDEGVRFPSTHPDALRALFEADRLSDVDVGHVVIRTDYRDFDDYWTPFLGGQGPAPAYLASLGSGARDAIRERLRSTLPTAADGSVALTARAWTVRATRHGSGVP